MSEEYLLQNLVPSKQVIYVDLDGVLVNFEPEVKKLTHGIGLDDFIKTEGRPKLWELINFKGSEWWANLPWTPDGSLLWNAIKFKNPTILTSGSVRNCGALAANGKRKWVYKHLGGINTIIADSSSHKKKHAGRGNVLIDDYSKNIEEWNSKGGIGIQHKNAADTLEQLKTLNII
jgi:hypothetical protein